MRRATRTERRAIRSIRRVSDSEVRQGQIRGSARVSKYLRLAFTQGLHAGHLGLDDPVAGPISVRAAERERRATDFPTAHPEGDRLDSDGPDSPVRNSSVAEWRAARARSIPEDPFSGVTSRVNLLRDNISSGPHGQVSPLRQLSCSVSPATSLSARSASSRRCSWSHAFRSARSELLASADLSQVVGGLSWAQLVT